MCKRTIQRSRTRKCWCKWPQFTRFREGEKASPIDVMSADKSETAHTCLKDFTGTCVIFCFCFLKFFFFFFFWGGGLFCRFCFCFVLFCCCCCLSWGGCCFLAHSVRCGSTWFLCSVRIERKETIVMWWGKPGGQ